MRVKSDMKSKRIVFRLFFPLISSADKNRQFINIFILRQNNNLNKINVKKMKNEFLQ